MPTIENYPQSLLDNTQTGICTLGILYRGSRDLARPTRLWLEFLTFHRAFLVHFHAWYDAQSGADQAAVAAWMAIPPEL